MAETAIPLLPGHRLTLLEGSGQYFAALGDALDAAQHEVWLETYICDFTASGAAVAEALLRAARRGLDVRLVVDGVGTGSLPADWAARFDDAGVVWRVYSPVGRLGLLLPRQWRRLHRKLCVVDGHTAFCGGINILDDFYDPNHGALDAPRFDFAVGVQGPLVAQVRYTMEQLWLRLQGLRDIRQRDFIGALRSFRDAGVRSPPAQRTAVEAHHARAALLLRDNLRNRTRIEKAYRRAVAHAHSEIIIANAYFLPGGKLRKALALAARRGVRVQLLLQGKYEYFMQYYAARPVYDALLKAGVEIHEYAASFLHAKVAVIDGQTARPWATVGSSNLDPLSLLLAREANVVVEDPAFAALLRTRLISAMAEGGHRVDAAAYANRPLLQRAKERLAWMVMGVALFIQGKRY